MESAVLRGAKATLNRTRAILIEMNFASHYHGDSLFPRLHDDLTKQGFFLHDIGRPYGEGRKLWCDMLYAKFV